jgi:glycosyltransferase involved in cell wall biosynthesis
VDAILINYPLSRDFQERLVAHVASTPMTLSLKELQQRSVLQILRYLRSLKVNRLFVPVEDENGSILLPVLKLLAVLVPARDIFLVEPDLRMQRISRFNIVGSTLKLCHASAATMAAVARAKRVVRGLLAAERVSVDEVVGRNVLYLNANLWFGVKAGGSVGHISGVVNALLQEEYDVDFASAGGQLMVSDKAAYVQLKPPTHFGVPWGLNHYRFHFDVVQQLKGLTARRHFDFIYQRLSVANFSGVVASRSLGIPLVLEYNGSEVWVARNWGRELREQVLAEQVEEVNLRHAHLVVTISDVLKEELLARGVAAERIVTYPNCIDPEMFNPERFTPEEIASLRARHGIPSDSVVVTFIGTFGQWHGIEILAKAIRQLIDNRQEWAEARKVHFLLVGDGMKMPEVRSILGSHAQGPFVTMTGLVPQHEAPLYLASSDVLCSPHVPNTDGTKFFGSPTKLFEYMAMGKAIVASDLDQIGDVLQNSIRLNVPESAEDITKRGRVALLVEPGDVEQLTLGIRRLIDEPRTRDALGANVRGLALERYTWKRHVNEILKGLRVVTKAQD